MSLVLNALQQRRVLLLSLIHSSVIFSPLEVPYRTDCNYILEYPGLIFVSALIRRVSFYSTVYTLQASRLVRKSRIWGEPSEGPGTERRVVGGMSLQKSQLTREDLRKVTGNIRQDNMGGREPMHYQGKRSRAASAKGFKIRLRADPTPRHTLLHFPVI